MKKLAVLSALLLSTGMGFAQELARVISSTPIISQISVPQRVCTTQPVAVQEKQGSAAGLAGFLLGGAVGNRFGSGDGRAAATLVGAVGGALLGDHLDKSTPTTRVENVQTCQTQNLIENRTVGYNVVYEYAGRQYATQMPSDPGSAIRVQVSPIIQQPVQVAPVVQIQQSVVYPVNVRPIYYKPHQPHPWQREFL